MIIEFCFAGIERFELMIEHLCVATFIQYLFKLLKFDFIL